MANNPLQIVIDKCEEDIDTRVRQLRTGNLPDIAEYKNVCGQILGLQFAIDHLKSLMQTMEDNDD
jgi:hypothetical protein